MTFDRSRYADNPFYAHVRKFRDTWLDASPKAHVSIGDVVHAYDVYCERNQIRRRKLTVHELIPELHALGVCLGRVRKPYVGRDGVARDYLSSRPAFVCWRLTRSARYAIREMPRLVQDYTLAPAMTEGEEDECES